MGRPYGSSGLCGSYCPRTDILPGVKLRLISLSILLALGATSCAGILSASAAVVNGVRISVEELDLQVDSTMKGGQFGPAQGAEGRLSVARQVLVGLIQQELITQEAARRGVVADKKSIDEEFAKIRAEFASEAEFNKRIAEFGYTIDSLRKRIGQQIVFEKLKVVLAGEVTDAQVREVYQAEQNRYRQVKVRHILWTVSPERTDAKARAAATAALAQIKAGASFAALAKKVSEDPGSKAKGGLLQGFVALASLDPTFGQAAWGAKIGTAVGPVRSQFGYHLIVTEARRTQPFSEVAEEIRAQMQGQAGDSAFSEFLKTEVKSAKVVVNPRYGDWDAENSTVVPHSGFVPAEEPSVGEQPPGGFGELPTGSGAPPAGHP